MNYSYLKTNKSEFYYLELGEQNTETIFFLCGANQEPEFYIRFFELISRQYRIVVLCYPGIGNNFILNGELTLNNYFNYIEAFVKDKFADQQIIACGISLGGLLLAKYINENRAGNFTKFIGLSILTRLTTTSLIGLALKYLLNETVKYQGLQYVSYTLSLFSLKNLRNSFEKRRQFSLAKNLQLKSDDLNWVNEITTMIIMGQKENVVDIKYTKELFSNINNLTYLEIKAQRHDAAFNIKEEILNIFNSFLQ